MKQHRVLRHSRSWWRSSWGGLTVRRHNSSKSRTLALKLKLSHAGSSMRAVLPVVEALIYQSESLQQLHRAAQFDPSVEIVLSLSLYGSHNAKPALLKLVENSADRLEALRSAKQIVTFHLEYEIVE